jgi:hypothetical protein
MQHRALIITPLLCAASCYADEERVLPGTASPNKQFAILESRAANGQRDYYFVHQPSRKRLGFVLPPAQRGVISNVAIVASWNTSSAKVALLVFYGTKLSELLLHNRASDGTFQQVEFREPDPLVLYRQRTGKTIPQPGDGYSENAVGPWVGEDTVMLVAGEAKQIVPAESETEDASLGEYRHVFVTFRARVRGRRAKMSDLRLIGPLTNATAEDFQKHWGEHYFSTHN